MLATLPVELLLVIARYLGLEGCKLRLCHEIEEKLNSISFAPYFFYRCPYLSIGNGIPLAESKECTLFSVPKPTFVDWVRKQYLDRWVSESGIKFRYRRKCKEESFSLMRMPEREGESIRFIGYVYSVVKGFRESHVVLYDMKPELYFQVREYFGKIAPRKPPVRYVRRVVYIYPNNHIDSSNEYYRTRRVKAIASMYVDIIENLQSSVRLHDYRRPERIRRVLAILARQRIEHGI